MWIYKKYKCYFPYILAIFAFIIGYFYDYQINTYLYHRNNIMGIFFERFALLPCLLFLLFSWFTLYRVKENIWFLIGFYLVGIYVVYDTFQYWFDWKIHWSWLTPLGIFSLLLLKYVLCKISIQRLYSYQKFCSFYIQVFVCSLLLTTVLKQIWGRIRFYDLQNDPSLFTRWTNIQWFLGFYSFPSGHTCVITTILCFQQLGISKNTKFELSPLIKCTLWIIIGIMMFARMLVGAHYLSDVTMGFLITYSFYLYFRKRCFQEEYLYESNSL